MTSPSPTPSPTEAPELIAVGAQSIVDRSKSLGLVWTRRLATVVDGSDPANCSITFDNDTVSVTAVSMVGALATDTRVHVDMVPPAGNFIVGIVTTTLNPMLTGIVNYNAAAAAGTTVSAAFANMPGSPTMTLVKQNASTRIRLDMHVTCLSTLANTSLQIGVLVNASDFAVASLVINPTSTHLQLSGTLIFTAAVSGSIPIVARWRRLAGGGTITQGTDDWVSMTAQEIR